MKHTQAKYWCINLLFSLLLISCTSEANKENIEVTKKLTEKKDTVINPDNQNDSINESFQKDTSLVAKENIKNNKAKPSIKKNIGPQPLKPVYVMMSEKKILGMEKI